MSYVVRSKDDLDQRLALAADKLVVIDFYANWCRPCNVIAPKLEELANHYSDRAMVLKVNVDENEELTEQYNVTSMPTFVFIKGGEVVELLVGCITAKLVKLMEKYIEGAEPPASPVEQQPICCHSSINASTVSSVDSDDISSGPSAVSGNSADISLCEIPDKARAIPEAKGAALEN